MRESVGRVNIGICKSVLSCVGSKGRLTWINRRVNTDSVYIAEKIDLGRALLSRICWSSDGISGMSYEGELHRGPWAGERFEVTTADKLQVGVKWKHITGEAIDALRKIWKSEFGHILAGIYQQ